MSGRKIATFRRLLTVNWLPEVVVVVVLPLVATDCVALIPGGAAHRPAKRWPVERYAELAALLAGRGVTPVVLGGASESDLGEAIRARVAEARDLTGATELADVAAIGRRALWAVGNDTGPMHLLVTAGAPATVLYSEASDPRRTAPRGACVLILRRSDLTDLPMAEVAATLPFG